MDIEREKGGKSDFDNCLLSKVWAIYKILLPNSAIYFSSKASLQIDHHHVVDIFPTIISLPKKKQKTL